MRKFEKCGNEIRGCAATFTRGAAYDRRDEFSPMKAFMLEIPIEHEDIMQEAIAMHYDGDDEACQSDEGQLLYEELAFQAKQAGLVFVKATDFGAIWCGTDAQYAACVERLPSWAKRYAGGEL